MIYYKEGIISVTNELALKDFSWKIKAALYNWDSDTVSVEVLMWEKEFVHSRSFVFDCNTDWTCDDCLKAILGLKQFGNSVEVK